ncbi:MAG: hypothetical protein A2X96_02215 [Syntrophobacterales bacterium GWC2_56_13]|nr:MAG: hypothetical protein A2X96_02215 [Syntrophobacterales bacterium GWC2_56_13]
MQMAFYFDQTRCTGCYTCYIACKEWHDIPAHSVQWLRIQETESGKYPDVFMSCTVSPCYHCVNPSCAEVCPTGCIAKRSQDGIVVVDREECLGKEACGQCLGACPYGAIQFRNKPDAKMEKCDFCLERLEEGRQPACVSSCPVRALDSGDIGELKVKYGKYGVVKTGPGLTYDKKNRPAFVIGVKYANSSYKRV